MTANLATPPKLQFFDNSGNPLVGGKLYSYAAGSTTYQTTYTDYTQTAANPNPIILDSRGEASVWFIPSAQYKLILKDATDVEIWSVDNLNGASDALSAALAAGNGASLVGFTQSGLNAVARTVQTKLYDFVTPMDFGAKGDGVTDDTAAIQAAFAASTSVDMAGKSYKVAGTITLRTGTTVQGNGATITQTAAQTEIFNTQNSSNIEIFGINFVGVGTDLVDSDSARAAGIYAGAAFGSDSYIDVHDCTFKNFTYAAFRAGWVSHVRFVDNVVIGPGAPPIVPTNTSGSGTYVCYGLVIEVCTHALISGSEFSQLVCGIRVEKSSYVSVVDNDVFDIVGQHGIYAGAGLINSIFSNNKISNCHLLGFKIQLYDVYALDNYNVVVSNNTITNSGDTGILIYNSSSDSTGTATNKNYNLIVSNNTVQNSGAYGIIIKQSVGAVISDNVIFQSTRSGLLISDSKYFNIDNNVISTSGWNGIIEQYPCSYYSITNNRLAENAQLAVSGNNVGILIQSAQTLTIADNIISDSTAKMQYGISITSSAPETIGVYNNVVWNSTSYGFYTTSTSAAFQAFRNNYFVGSLGPANTNPTTTTVASATTITLPQNQDVVQISGSATITTINTAGLANARVTLVFTGTASVTDGSNIKLASSFTATADDTLTLACVGSNWYEVARSVN